MKARELWMAFHEGITGLRVPDTVRCPVCGEKPAVALSAEINMTNDHRDFVVLGSTLDAQVEFACGCGAVTEMKIKHRTEQ